MRDFFDDEDDFLSSANMSVDAQFEAKLLKNLKTREKQIIKSRKQAKFKKIFVPTVAGLGTASLILAVAILANLNPSTKAPLASQEALAYDVFEQVKNKPISSINLAADKDDQSENGQYLHRTTVTSYGPAFPSCNGNPDLTAKELDEQKITTDTYIFSELPDTEIYYEKTTSFKGKEPIMIYDTDPNTNKIDLLAGDEESQFEYFKENGELVDANGNPLTKDSKLEEEMDNGNKVYRLRIKLSKEAQINNLECVNPKKEENKINELILDADDLVILENNIYLDSINDENLLRSTITSLDKRNGKYEEFAQILVDAGFNLDIAEDDTQTDDQTQDDSDQVQDKLPGLDIPSNHVAAWGDISYIAPSASDQVANHTITFKNRADLMIHVSELFPEGNDVGGGDGFPTGLNGFRKETDSEGNTVYRDIYLERIFKNSDIDIDSTINASKITELKVDGRDAILAENVGGIANMTYTIINTGDAKYPAIVIAENPQMHAKYVDAWQSYLDNLNF